jgi:hypothetical protein
MSTIVTDGTDDTNEGIRRVTGGSAGFPTRWWLKNERKVKVTAKAKIKAVMKAVALSIIILFITSGSFQNYLYVRTTAKSIALLWHYL